MQQKIKAETGAHGMYKLDMGHEFHCMWTPTYNHKVQILTKALVYLCAAYPCVTHVLRGLNRTMPKMSFLDQSFSSHLVSLCFLCRQRYLVKLLICESVTALSDGTFQ